MGLKQYILIVVSFICSGVLTAQDKSNRGKEFWVGYGFHWIMLNSDVGGTIPVNSQEMAIYISAEQAATVR